MIMIARKILPALAIILVVVFAYQLIQKRNSVSTPVKSNPQATNNITTTSTLKIDPVSISLKVGEEKKLSVILDSSNDVSGVQLVASYDPNVISVKEITAGDFMVEPSILLQEIDNSSGRANFAVGTFKPKSGSGKAVMITVVGKSKGKASLNLTGSKVAVSQHELNDLKETSDSQITIN
jgi:hypothetical protein